MKTIRSRNTMRGHGDRRRHDERDEFSQSSMEDSWRNEDYYFDRADDDRGYDNRDYSGNNYWPSRRDVREERSGQYSSYVPSLDYGRGYHEASRRRAVGYGNDGSGYMRDFESWRRGDDRYEEGYAGRNSGDYQNGYGDRRYYDPSDYNRGGMRRNPESENYNTYYENEGRYARRGDDSYSYGDYQSYPAYEARGYSRDEYHPEESRRFRNRPRSDGREYGDRHRPSIREKRY